MTSARGADGSVQPFPGLRPFREDEEAFFFGRESQVDQMVDRLGATRLLAVVGSSGSGKSSLVNCGLIPALHRGLLGAAGSGWRIATMRPGNRPLRALAEALAAPGVLAQPDLSATGFSAAEMVEATLRSSRLGIVEAYREAAPADARRNLLLVVDQFEELFRYRALAGSGPPAADEAVAFVNLLLEAAAAPALPLYVVLTMRSDFLGECAQFGGLPEAINRGQYLVPRMTREERRAAIAGPVRVAGASIDPVLLTRLVNDVGDNPDQLSILQHALNRTWACWQDDGGTGPLQTRHYESAGTMAQALNRHADQAFDELPAGRLRELCEAVFRAVTDTGTDARGIRRPTRFDDLQAITGGSADELVAVMKPFRDPSRAFLMPPAGAPLDSGTPVDISHESLMRVWDRLKGWGDAEAQDAQAYRRLAETAALHAQGRAGLLVPPELPMALAWRQRRRPVAAWAQRYRGGFAEAMAFLEASAQAQAEREQAAAQAEQARRRAEAEAETLRRRAEADRRDAEERERQREARSRQNRRWTIAVVAGLAVVSAALTALALKAGAQAQAAQLAQVAAEAEAREARRLAAEADNARAAAQRASYAQQREAELIAQIRAQAAPEARARIDKALEARPVVYIHYADEAQAGLAGDLRRRLDGAGYAAPQVDKVGTVPARSELRYFRRDDEAAARQLLGQLQQWHAGTLELKLLAGLEGRTQLRRFELWLARPAAGDLARLARQLDSAAKAERLAAGQLLQSRYLDSPEAIARVLDLFAPQRIDELSAEGRINALYYLSRTAPRAWTPELLARGRRTVDLLEERDGKGIRLGPQTRAEVDAWKRLLAAAS